MALLIAHPWVAGLVAAAFAGVWLWRSRRASALAAAAWALYCAYEYLMYARILCTGECNIRVDLLLIYPALAALTLFGVFATLRAWNAP
jgi:hypothetical protein